MLPSNQERNGRSLFECLFPFSLDCLKYMNTYRISSDATATIFYAVCFCVTILFEGGVFISLEARRHQRWLDKVRTREPLLDAVSSTCSLSVLLSAVETTRTTQIALSLVW